MTKKARNPEDIERIKEDILNKSLDIIVESGYGNLTMRRIASKNSMSATNLYQYFTNKEEIYLSLLINGYKILYSKLQSAFEKSLDPIEQGRALVNAYLSFGFEEAHYYELMFTRPAPRYEDYKETALEKLASVERELTRKIVDICAECIRAILLKQSSPEDIEQETKIRLIHVWSILHGMIVLNNNKIVYYVNDDPAAVYDRLIDEYFRLIVEKKLNRND